MDGTNEENWEFKVLPFASHDNMETEEQGSTDMLSKWLSTVRD